MKKNREKENKDITTENIPEEDGRVFSDTVRAASLVIVLIAMVVWSPMIALIVEARFNEVQPTRYEHIILSVVIFLTELLIFSLIVLLPIRIRNKIRERRSEKKKNKPGYGIK